MKKRIVLRLSPEVVNKPLVSDLVKSYSISVNILNADISSGRDGMLVVELDGAEISIEKSIEHLKGEGVSCSPHVKELSFRQDECIACGSCTAVCFSGALAMDEDSWELLYDADKCIVCGLCVEACPLRLFSLSRD
ncbi:MAG: 4Fe-4S binding protein [Spirochaetales bacterium]|jgi:ferredoxin|nr:4Fe-4S binding protein [Spirochaetales bacterium]